MIRRSWRSSKPRARLLQSGPGGPDTAAEDTAAVRRRTLQLWTVETTARLDTIPNIKLVLPAVRAVLRTILVIIFGSRDWRLPLVMDELSTLHSPGTLTTGPTSTWKEQTTLWSPGTRRCSKAQQMGRSQLTWSERCHLRQRKLTVSRSDSLHRWELPRHWEYSPQYSSYSW